MSDAATRDSAVFGTRFETPLPSDFREYKLLRYLHSLPAIQDDPLSVLRAIDTFCRDSSVGEWMMNIGDKKGKVLETEVKRLTTIAEEQKQKGGDVVNQVIVEVGTYCGYSAILIASHMGPSAHLYCFELDVLHAAIARAIVDYAGLSNRITIIVGTVTTHLLKELKTKRGISKIDLLFLDHVKDAYLSDVKYIETNGFIQSGSVIVADNIIYPGCPDYANYIRNNNNYKSTFHEGTLEYTTDVKDGVEVSVRL